jgi:hypothetical protein
MSKRAFGILTALVNKTAGNENSCRDAFMPFAECLIANTSLKFVKAEVASNIGRADLILIVEPVETDFGSKLLSTDKIAIIYEMKAPNKPMYQYHKTNRFIPSEDLSLAESQLLAYTRRCQQDAKYLSETYGATDVKPGGIIIGRESTMFNISKSDRKKIHDEHSFDSLKKATLAARKHFLYDRASINVYTWDHIINLIKPKFIVKKTPKK